MSRTLRWGVVGLGRAGQARINAIAARPHLALAGTVGRRPGRGTTTLDALCADPTVDGILVCSENAHHVEAAARGLEAGKHVAVEFPLAPSAAEGRRLYDLARAAGVVLHCELIGLLTARHRAAREVCRAERVAWLVSEFEGGSYRWVADEVAAGRVGQLALGRLHALHDLVGPLTLGDVRCAWLPEGFRLEVELTGSGGERVTLREARAPGSSRAGRLSGALADGRPFAPAPRPEPGDLFGRDLDHVVALIGGGGDADYAPESAVLEMLALAERISAAAAA